MTRLLTVAAIFGLAACTSEPTYDLQEWESAAIDAWLLCTDCTNGELDSIISLSTNPSFNDRALPRFADALEQGPPQSSQDNVRDQFRAIYERLEEYKSANPQEDLTLQGQTAYIDWHLANFVADYQIHAAFGLGWIRTPDAVAVLTTALTRPYPPRVLLAVDSALSIAVSSP